jgi:hypothetical protein
VKYGVSLRIEDKMIERLKDIHNISPLSKKTESVGYKIMN